MSGGVQHEQAHKTMKSLHERKFNCAGCVYWRRMFKGSNIWVCNFMEDTGASRIRLCGMDRCTVRKERWDGRKRVPPKAAEAERA